MACQEHVLKETSAATAPHSWLALVRSCKDARGAAPAAVLCLTGSCRHKEQQATQPTSSLQQQEKTHLGIGEVVHHAPWGAHNDVGPLAQGNGLCHHVHAAHQYCALDANACPQCLKLLTDLNGQLARGGQNQAKQGLRLVQQGLQQAPSPCWWSACRCSRSCCWQDLAKARRALTERQQPVFTCRMGIAKAPVLPEPVCARPMTSLPAASPQIGHAQGMSVAVLFLSMTAPCNRCGNACC